MSLSLEKASAVWNTGFQIIRAEYNFVFPGNTLNNRLLLAEISDLEP